MAEANSLAARAARSAWASAEPHLAEAVADLDREVGTDQRLLDERAIALANVPPGAVDPVRLARHAAAAAVSRAIRTTISLPSALASGRPFTDPQGWAQQSAIEAFVDQLALGGPPSAELARLIAGAGALFPEALRRELAKRHIRPLAVEAPAVQQILDRAFRPGEPGGGLQLIGSRPFAATPVSQVHVAATAEGREVGVRVRRPRIQRDLDTDNRLAAGAAAALARIMPDVGHMGPAGFVQLVMRQTLESTDLRFEARNLVELGLVAEQLGIEAIVVPRPIPGYIDERALATELLDGVALDRYGKAVPDPAGALLALAGLTLEASLVHGVFWADPSPEHLVVLPDGRLGLVGVANLGRLTPELRLAGVTLLKSVLTGEPEGQLEAMRIAGAVTPDVDEEAVVEALRNAEALDPSKILFGGESGFSDALNTVVGIMLAHKLAPPVEVTLLLRTVFAVGTLADAFDPSGETGIVAALMPLLPRLPEIIAAAEAAVHGPPADGDPDVGA